ncbi:MAG TPA: WYL domain-containing protein [Baekduia sp.]|uniref:helix-turn-helix transcriptional regulator n=1 Tax=Baekduia sp. TaxID=2600305 RepID=UPI002D790E65|nr:WYL domain-containing protein [Baekduia sp.]HET6509858.1 WYL domain-containing protein [Baekduia sp.]
MTGPPQRLLSLLSVLQVPRIWPGSELSERLGVSRRTLRRDVEALRELGYPVEAVRGGQGGYRLVGGTALPPLALDDAEAVAMAVGLRLAGAGPLKAADVAATGALAKLTQVLPPRLRHRVDSLSTAITADPLASSAAPVDPEALVTLAGAIARQERLRFSYTRPDRAPARRHAEPHALVVASGRWRFIAFDLDRDAWRTFRLDRAAELTATGAPSRTKELPGGDIAAFVVADALGTHTLCAADVLIHAPVDQAAAALGEPVGEQLVPVEGDRCRWTSPPDTIDWLVFRLATLRLPFVVHGPPELAAAVRDVAERFAAATDPAKCGSMSVT